MGDTTKSDSWWPEPSLHAVQRRYLAEDLVPPFEEDVVRLAGKEGRTDVRQACREVATHRCRDRLVELTVPDPDRDADGRWVEAPRAGDRDRLVERAAAHDRHDGPEDLLLDRKSTRLNSSHRT